MLGMLGMLGRGECSKAPVFTQHGVVVLFPNAVIGAEYPGAPVIPHIQSRKAGESTIPRYCVMIRVSAQR